MRKQYKRTKIQYYKDEVHALSKEIKSQIRKEKNKRWEDHCNDMELDESPTVAWSNLSYISGAKKAPPKISHPH